MGMWWTKIFTYMHTYTYIYIDVHTTRTRTHTCIQVAMFLYERAIGKVVDKYIYIYLYKKIVWTNLNKIVVW